MATTTNYGWTTPDDTALVKDGASAIRSLGSAIDTSLNTALGTKKSGLVLLNTTSFSAVSSQSVNDVFSATYDCYKVLIDYTGSGALTLSFRFRVAGADNSGANYQRQSIFNNGDTVINAAKTNNATSLTLSSISASTEISTVMIDFLTNPFSSVKKSFITLNADNINTGVSSTIATAANGFNNTSSFTGFSIIASTNNITGSVRTYGYNK